MHMYVLLLQSCPVQQYAMLGPHQHACAHAIDISEQRSCA